MRLSNLFRNCLGKIDNVIDDVDDVDGVDDVDDVDGVDDVDDVDDFDDVDDVDAVDDIDDVDDVDDVDDIVGVFFMFSEGRSCKYASSNMSWSTLILLTLFINCFTTLKTGFLAAKYLT